MDVFKISVPNGMEVGTFDNTIRKEHLKDKKEELERINKWWIIYFCCVNNM